MRAGWGVLLSPLDLAAQFIGLLASHAGGAWLRAALAWDIMATDTRGRILWAA
jgi:hypothetical protein